MKCQIAEKLPTMSKRVPCSCHFVFVVTAVAAAAVVVVDPVVYSYQLGYYYLLTGQ